LDLGALEVDLLEKFRGDVHHFDGLVDDLLGALGTAGFLDVQDGAFEIS
jgi:hypothetical protein